MVNGDPVMDRIQLNIESLWLGGPFADRRYNGGNHLPSERLHLASELARIRNTIFTSSTGTIGDVQPLPIDSGLYGSYSGAGYLNINRIPSSNFTNYVRWLDMDNGVLKTTWTEPSGLFNRTYFCSNPTRACTIHTVSSNPGGFTATFYFSSVFGLPDRNITCLDSDTIQLRGYAGSPGMLYEILAKLGHSGPSNSSAECTLDANSGDAVLSVRGSTEAWVSWVGGTEYSMEAGNSEKGYTFKGPDPHSGLVLLLARASSQSVVTALSTHIMDYRSALGGFSLNIGQKSDNSKTTAQLQKEYKADVGNPYLEWRIFNYGRYMLVASSQSYLPANLQGVWARDVAAPWSAGIKGSEDGNTAAWANYPESAAWMMMHLYDHLDYTNDIAWWRSRGWPLLKGVTQFWLDHLVEDQRFKDGTLVTAPCNSPEQTVVTLGCSHSQQLIWQLFESVEKGFSASNDDDTDFLHEVQTKKLKLDKGIRIDSWGQLQEWKIEFDSQTGVHRHLSHLIGLYPGYVLTNFNPSTNQTQGIPSLTRRQVLKASEISLIARGNGTGLDADAGWEKIWRAACWAQLQNSTQFYHILTYAIERNFGENLWSLYHFFGDDPIVQIDANLGYPPAVLNAIVQAPDTSSLSDTLDITLLPALPPAWATGSIFGTRIRGGMTLDMKWSNGKVLWVRLRVDPEVRYVRRVQLWHGREPVTAFSATSGLKRKFVF
ncbi:hypothetical protein OPQ81_002204 [Rhizoctonia solani]|nr:hypothetical protein OPQ81_002204 [Rhizoctonia solani]